MLDQLSGDLPLPSILAPELETDAPSLPAVYTGARTNLMAGDLVEINRASVNGRAWMSTIAAVKRVLLRGTRAELLSDPTRSEGRIWVSLRLLDEPSGEHLYVATRYLDLVEARAAMPLTIELPPHDLERDNTLYLAGDLIHTNVTVNLRSAPGTGGAILREIEANSVASLLHERARIGETDWIKIELPGIEGWVAKKHTRLFARHEKWIEVELSTQTLIAWNVRAEERRLTMSSGKSGFCTPAGTFSILDKFPARRTIATVNGEHWDIPGVPWVMVFRAGGYYLHGVYWHNNFGTPVSHGCVTLTVPDAEWLYGWTPLNAPVWIHD